MRVLYIDCGMGVAGDMLTAGLLELMPEPEKFVEKLNKIGIPGVEYHAERSVKCGITGTSIRVLVSGEEEHVHDHHEHGNEHEDEHCEHDHGHHEHECCHKHEDEHCHDHDNHDHDHDHQGHHHHSSMHDIEHIVRDHMNVSDKVKEDILAVYGLIAEAESHVHGVPVTEIHFHEVGTMDALADVTAVSMLMEELSIDKVVVSPVHVGSGQVRCAHGILPVPAPATAFILKGIPMYSGSIKGELCTPTGAALLKHFADEFGPMPVLSTIGIGYGMGKKDFEAANCVRVILGEAEDISETVLELSCNVDDMTAEEIGAAMESLFNGGALEVYTVPVGMKKSRTGTLIRVMCRPDQQDDMVKLIFKHTTTIGIRETATRRFVLDRRIETVETEYGSVRIKKSSGYGVTREKYEYDDLLRIAKEENVSVTELKSKLGK